MSTPPPPPPLVLVQESGPTAIERNREIGCEYPTSNPYKPLVYLCVVRGTDILPSLRIGQCRPTSTDCSVAHLQILHSQNLAESVKTSTSLDIASLAEISKLICVNKSLILSKTNQPNPTPPNHLGNHYSMPKSSLILIKLSEPFHNHQPR